MKIKYSNKQLEDIVSKGMIHGGDVGTIYLDQAYYIETQEPNIIEVLCFNELSKEQQELVLVDDLMNLKNYMDKYGDEYFSNITNFRDGE